MERRKSTTLAKVKARGSRRVRHSRQNLWALLLGVACILSASPAGFAQQAEIDHLASQVAQEITAAGKRKVAVADFVAVNGKSVPLGTWLVDQFSAALAKAEPSLDIIDRAKVKAALQAQPVFKKDSESLDSVAAKHMCESLGAEILVTATLGRLEKAVGISLHSSDCLYIGALLGGWIAPTNGKIALSPEMEALLPESLESPVLPGGVWKAGQGGAGEPSCIRCPSPSYSNEAVKKKKSGVVIMGVTVTVDGHAADIKLLKSLGYGLDEKQWKPSGGGSSNPLSAQMALPCQCARSSRSLSSCCRGRSRRLSQRFSFEELQG